MPSLDTIVPMLRSFDGLVDFHMAAETDLDSTMMVDLPTLGPWLTLMVRIWC